MLALPFASGYRARGKDDGPTESGAAGYPRSQVTWSGAQRESKRYRRAAWELTPSFL